MRAEKSLKRAFQKRHIVDCRRREANQARYRAHFETQKVLRLRKQMWRRVKWLLFKEWLRARRLEAIVLTIEILGSFAAVYGIYRLGLIWTEVMRG